MRLFPQFCAHVQSSMSQFSGNIQKLEEKKNDLQVQEKTFVFCICLQNSIFKPRRKNTMSIFVETRERDCSPLQPIHYNLANTYFCLRSEKGHFGPVLQACYKTYLYKSQDKKEILQNLSLLKENGY